MDQVLQTGCEGALIAATLDLKLRADSDGDVSLDDVMRACWQRWGSGDEGMPEDGFESVCAELARHDMNDFFDAAVRGTGDLPLPAMLATVGVQYHLRQSANRTDKGGKKKSGKRLSPLWLGASTGDSGGKLVFKSVLNGGPAEKAGIAPGDVAVALDGVALTTANYDRRLRSYHDGETLELVVFRGVDLLTMKIKLADAPEDTCYLSIDDEAEMDVVARREDWLQTA
jgi:predicted metalloprotease with PDZ domain